MLRFLFLVVGLVAIVACGGGGDSTPTEDSLRSTVSEYADAVQHANMSKSYSFLDDSYKAKCSSGDWSGNLLLALAFNPDVKNAELRIDSVTIDGTRGHVVGDYYLDGRALGLGNNPDTHWEFHDGKWWLVNDKPDPCHAGSSTPN